MFIEMYAVAIVTLSARY